MVFTEERHGPVGVGVEEGHKNDQRAWDTSAVRTG